MIVQLTKMWLTNVVTTEMIGAQTEPGRDATHSVKGEIRNYAGGRQRAVGSLGASRTWTFTLVELTQSNVDTLTTWMESGVTVLARDHRGQWMYGTFFDVAVKENPSQLYQYATYSAAITLQAVDVIEGI